MNKILVACIVLCLTIIGCASQAPGEGTQVVQETATEVKSEPEKTVPEAAPSETVYEMNTEVPVDYLTYRITKAETFTEMGTEFLDKQTEGKFIKVYLEIMNTAKETKDIFTPRFSIIDDQGRKYDRLSDDMMYISDILEFGAQLQPGLSKEGAIVFELPKDSQDLVLLVSGDWLSGKEVKIKITNIEDIGADTTLEDETDEDIEAMMSKCSAPFKCNSNCPEHMDVGQKDCDDGELCCME